MKSKDNAKTSYAMALRDVQMSKGKSERSPQYYERKAIQALNYYDPVEDYKDYIAERNAIEGKDLFD